MYRGALPAGHYDMARCQRCFFEVQSRHTKDQIKCDGCLLLRFDHCTWVKPGRFGSFFVLCFLALGGHCLQMLCLPGFGTHANTQSLPHFRDFPASIREHSPPKCRFFMANAKLPNRPGFALLYLTISQTNNFQLRARRPMSKKTHKQYFHGIVPGLSRDYPGIFPRFPGNVVYVFSLFPQDKGKTLTNLTPTRSRDNPEKLFMLIGVFLSPDFKDVRPTT